MRVPPQAQARRPRRTARGRVVLVTFVAVAFVVLTSLRGMAVFYTDYLWFQELKLAGIWRAVLGAKAALVAIFTLGFFGLAWVNLFIADRLAPKVRTVGPEDELILRYRETVGPHAGKLRIAVAALFALLAGSGVAGQWHNWLLYRNGVNFGQKDAQFGKDIGFFVFKLPFIAFLIDWFFVAVVIVAVISLFTHYLNGGIRLQAVGRNVTPQVKAHLSVLLGLMALVKAAGYWFQRYELNFSTRGAVDGAGYTDVKAQLPALNLLLVIMIAAFVLFLLNIRRQGWVLPVIAVGLWMLVSVIVGAVYPAFVQKFRVEPSENTKERPYIERNIAATRSALGMDKIKMSDFDYREDLTGEDLTTNAETIRNIRLWDPAFVVATYQKLQEIRSYYKFNEVDIDRYILDGKQTQTLLSVRELRTEELPSRSWVNRHLQFTHGYGGIVAAANAATADGRPSFRVQDVPPKGEPEIKQPRIYYGEKQGGYAIVRTEQAEFDFPKATGGDQTTSYDGKGGVELSSYLRRSAMALRFGDMNFLISGLITPESRALYNRDIGPRVRSAAPFLRYDIDPYPVIVDGRILWIQDAYTTTTRYPYAQRADVDRLANGSGLASTFNYVRNSVKVVIDAYDGTMTFYLIDDEDPLAKTYDKAFPDLFTPASQMSDELRSHLRYPEDLFRVQTTMFGRYHITDPLEFYNAGDAWNVSQDPGSGSPVAAAQSSTRTVDNLTVVSREKRMDPTYILARLPGQEDEDFLLLQPMVPSSEQDKARNLTAFLVANSDPDKYGEISAYVMPRGRVIDGPALVDAKIAAEPSISQLITQLNQQGSKVLLGNVLVLPIEQSLIYVRPLYVSSQRNELPELKHVIVVYADRAVMRPTLKEALAEIFGAAPPTEESGTPSVATPTVGAPSATVIDLLTQASKAFDDADAALRAGDLATYQKKNKEGAEFVRRARAAEQQSSSPSSSTTTTAKAA